MYSNFFIIYSPQKVSHKWIMYKVFVIITYINTWVYFPKIFVPQRKYPSPFGNFIYLKMVIIFFPRPHKKVTYHTLYPEEKCYFPHVSSIRMPFRILLLSILLRGYDEIPFFNERNRTIVCIWKMLVTLTAKGLKRNISFNCQKIHQFIINSRVSS